MSDYERRIYLHGRRMGKSHPARELAEKMLDAGKNVLVIGKSGEPIIPPDWIERVKKT